MQRILLLSLLSFIFAVSSAQDCDDLFFSEYLEGSANNKTLEIYNPTPNPIDLGIYVIKRYSNGSPVPTEQLALSGTIQPYDAIVITNGQTDSIWVTTGGGYWSLPIDDALYALGDLHCSGIYPTPMYFNGDDAMTLETTTGGVVDIFGKIGDYPGENGWNDLPPTYTAGDQYWTSWSKDQTLIRKSSVKSGVEDNPSLFMINVEWDSVAKDTFDSLGFHKCDCQQLGIVDPINLHSVVIYPNPVTGNKIGINASADWNRIEVINLLGQEILNVQLPSSVKRHELSIPKIEEGVYLMKIYFDDRSVMLQKLVIR